MNKAQFTALAILIAGILWIGSGVIKGKSSYISNINTQNAAVEEPPVAVRVHNSVARPFQSDVTLQGRTAASREVDLRAEVYGRADEVIVREGQSVTTNQPIVEIEIYDREARLDQARASLEQRRIQVDAARSLAKQNFGTQVRLAEAEAQFEQAKADVVRFTLDLANTIVRAPFDGILDTRSVEVGAVLTQGEKIGTIVDLDPLKVTGQISERNVRDVVVGMEGRMILSDGSEIIGNVSYLASVSDPNTRTFRLEMLVPNPGSLILAGIAAQLRLPAGQRMAHNIPSSTLTLADDGQIGLKTVDVDNKIVFFPVEILDDGPEGIWVSGLPEKANIIVVGQDYVAVGQKVTPVIASMSSDQS